MLVNSRHQKDWRNWIVFHSELSRKDWDALELIKQAKVYEDYFFKKAKDFKWFYELKNRGYFDPDKNPDPRESDDKDGYYKIPYWNILDYLKKLSSQADCEQYNYIVEELLDIIRSVSEYRNADEKHIDNYHTWSSFVEILSNIPASMIPIDTLKYIPTWLDSGFDNMLTTSAIMQKLIPHIAKSAEADPPNAQAIKQLSAIFEGLFVYDWEDVDEGFRSKSEPILRADSYWITEALSSEGYINKLMKIEFYKPIKIVADKLADVLSQIQHPTRPIVTYNDTKYEVIIRFDNNNEVLIDICSTETEEPYSSRDDLDKVLSKSLRDYNLGIIKSKTLFNEYHEFVSQFRANLKDNFAKGIARQFKDEELLYSYHWLYQDYSSIWFRDLSNIDDRHHRKIHHVLMIVLTEMVTAAAYIRPNDVIPLLKELSEPKYHSHIFRRIVFLAISKNWEILKPVFWEIFDQPNGYLLLSFEAFDAELYILFESIADKLTAEEAQKLKRVIERGKVILPDGPISDDIKRDREKIQKGFRFKWYSSLKKNDFFSEEYDKYKELIGVEFEPGFRQPTTFAGPGESPLNIDEILRMPVDKLADYLKTYRSKDRWRGPNANALAKNLHEAVKAEPKHFVEGFNYFIETRFLYIYEIIFGLRDAWRVNKDINWNNVLPFFIEYVNRESFWNDELIVQDDEDRANHRWVVGMVAWLIQDITESDKHAIEMEFNDKIIKLLNLLWRGISKEEDDDKYSMESRPVDFASNSIVGRIIQASIYLSLRIARNTKEDDKKDKYRWHLELKNIFLESIEIPHLEPFIFLGWMLPQIAYLDKSYAEMARKQILESDNDFLWKIFFYSYLFGSLSSPLYFKLMVDHYKKAIKSPISEWDTEELLMRHIGMGYLMNFDDFNLKDGLMKDVFDDWNYGRVNQLLFFLMGQYHRGLKPSDKGTGIVFGKIYDVWRLIYNRYKSIEDDVLTDKDKEILSNTSQLIAFLTEITKENYEWLSLVAPYVQVNYNSPRFVEHLERLKNTGEPKQTAEYVGNLYLLMLRNYKPYYKQEQIISTLDFIYDNDNKKIGDKICDMYLSGDDTSRFMFVRDIWKKYND